MDQRQRRQLPAPAAARASSRSPASVRLDDARGIARPIRCRRGPARCWRHAVAACTWHAISSATSIASDGDRSSAGDQREQRDLNIGQRRIRPRHHAGDSGANPRRFGKGAPRLVARRKPPQRRTSAHRGQGPTVPRPSSVRAPTRNSDRHHVSPYVWPTRRYP